MMDTLDNITLADFADHGGKEPAGAADDERESA
jgi:hypothetical protein